ncbi:hypothetical protein PLICRDRAFT_138521 [Plicaturopsis crispa FD-325 SS-3]|nr:hypothetical protein PLICRDRAFT_138521 [Plicaturopsis crispa FD-325 SS-3]
MKSFAVLAVFTSVAMAQSSSSATATATASPLIPSGISSGCTTFLKSLNSDTSLSGCTAPLIAATSSYSPGNATTNATAAAIKSSLGGLCSATSSCDQSTLRTKLANFYSACSAELTSSPNQDVLAMYDVIYAITPLSQAVCAKDDSGNYCATQIASTTSSSAASGPSGVSNDLAVGGSTGPDLSAVQKYLVVSPGSSKKRASTAAQALMPNTTTFAASNLLFMFLQPSLDSAALCTSCTRSILTSYINWESSAPYAPGLSNSPMLKGQSDLYKGIQSTCGTNFLSGAVQAAGGLGTGDSSSGAAPTAKVASAALGVVALGFVALL